jgi:hypothetical protein
LRTKDVFRKPFDLNDYDFSEPGAHLIASVNGRYHKSELYAS